MIAALKKTPIWILPKIVVESYQKTCKSWYGEQCTEYTEKIWYPSDNASKFKKCCFEKNAFKDIVGELIELSGYTLKGGNSKTISDIDLKFKHVIFKVIIYQNIKKNVPSLISH